MKQSFLKEVGCYANYCHVRNPYVGICSELWKLEGIFIISRPCLHAMLTAISYLTE